MMAGGRWNSVGVPVVYTSGSLALAVLEVFVHMDLSEVPPDMMALKLEFAFDESLLNELKQQVRRGLPTTWRERESSEARAFGDAWVHSKRSLILPVPSIAVQGEWNLLLNPTHPDAKERVKSSMEPFFFDERMFHR